MSEHPEAAPLPEKPPTYLHGGNVLLCSPVSLIDACISVPAVRALRHARPTANLVILCPSSLVPLWQSVDGLNLVLDYPDAASARQIAKVIESCPQQLESALAWEHSKAADALRRAEIPQRLGFDARPLNRHLTDPLPVFMTDGPLEHKVRTYLSLIESLEIEAYHPRNFQSPPRPAAATPPRIALVPGTTLGESYHWDLANFTELADLLLANHQLQLVTLAFPGTENRALELAQRVQGPIKNFAGEFDLIELMSALPHCSLVIGNDGPLCHLAAHVGTPCVALFGPGDPVTSRPLGKQHVVLSEHHDCSPCSETPCPLGHGRCLQELSVQRVYREVAKKLRALGMA